MIGDFNTMKKEFEDTIMYSQAYPFKVNASALLNRWRKMKAPFIRAFGGKTLIRSEKPIKVQLTTDARSRKFKDFMSDIQDTYNLGDDLYTFIQDNEGGFFENKVVKPYPERNIQAGAKLLKSFKKFSSDIDTVRYIQDIASQYIQEDKIEGYLYISVDPRDFLTLSENNEKWTSCHSLDGDYRSGNLSYMTDRVTAIAYIADKEKKQLRCMPEGTKWYSKKWRMLLHIELGRVVYFNKQYPFSQETIQEYVYKMLKDTFPALKNIMNPYPVGFKKISYYGCTMNLLENAMMLDGTRVYNSRDVINYDDYLGFEDLVASPTYTPMASVDSKLYSRSSWDDPDHWFHSMMDIKIGDAVPCVGCNGTNGQIKRTNNFLCDMCIADYDADEDFFCSCTGCGRRFYEGDEIFDEYDGELYCKKCYNDITKMEEEEDYA